MSEDTLRMLDIVAYCIWAFAHRYGIPQHEAYLHLRQHGGIDFLLEFAELEGTLDPEEIAEDLAAVTNYEGGTQSC